MRIITWFRRERISLGRNWSAFRYHARDSGKTPEGNTEVFHSRSHAPSEHCSSTAPSVKPGTAAPADAFSCFKLFSWDEVLKSSSPTVLLCPGESCALNHFLCLFKHLLIQPEPFQVLFHPSRVLPRAWCWSVLGAFGRRLQWTAVTTVWATALWYGQRHRNLFPPQLLQKSWPASAKDPVSIPI